MNAKTKALMLMGCQRAGSYDPDQAMPYFEEQLTFKEVTETRKFLQWVLDNNLKFGIGNLNLTLKQWKRSK